MPPKSARAHAHKYVEAIRSRMPLQHAMREAGLDIRRIAQKQNKLIDALEPKWNPDEKHWGFFDDTTAQLEAIKQVARLLNLYPAESSSVEPEQVTVIVDVPL